MKYSRILSIASAALLAAATGCTPKADTIVVGNIITMDENNMRAEAMTIKDGCVQFVGTLAEAEKYCGPNTNRENYGELSVYPGFIDAHVHPAVAGSRFVESINLVGIQTVDGYLDAVREFIAAHPEKKQYKGAGWSPRDREMTAKDLDAICSDKPILLNSIDGHSYWMNSIALQTIGFTREVAQQDGPAMVHVDADGNPSGVVVEETERVAQNLKPEIEEEMEGLLLWQDFAFGLGLTTVGDAGFGSIVDLDAYKQLDSEGKYKLLTYSSYYEPVPGQSVDDKVAHAKQAKADYEGEFFRISGIKMFVDGVVEGHTAWVIDEYLDQPGYYGVKKLDDHDYLVDLIKKANAEGFYVHLHTIGDGAVKFAVDALDQAQKESGVYDARNCMAHLQLVRPEDVKRMADNKIIPIVAPLWTPYDEHVSPLEEKYIGAERCDNAYPIKSFIEAGATIVFHTDYPVSTAASIPASIATAVLRGNPGMPARQQEKEGISRLQALQAMTTNSAYALGDDTIGSLAIGKKANYAVFDRDFLSDPIEEVRNSRIVVTAVQGEVVYRK